jgi:hypothetical protein
LSTTPTKITMNPRYKGYKEIFWLHFNWLVNYFFFIELYWSDWWNICTVAHERRRGDRPPTKNVIWGIYISGQCRETRNSLSLSSEKWCGSRHLVFWSLVTLTGLRDRVRGLVA